MKTVIICFLALLFIDNLSFAQNHTMRLDSILFKRSWGETGLGKFTYDDKNRLLDEEFITTLFKRRFSYAYDESSKLVSEENWNLNSTINQYENKNRTVSHYNGDVIDYQIIMRLSLDDELLANLDSVQFSYVGDTIIKTHFNWQSSQMNWNSVPKSLEIQLNDIYKYQYTFAGNDTTQITYFELFGDTASILNTFKKTSIGWRLVSSWNTQWDDRQLIKYIEFQQIDNPENANELLKTWFLQTGIEVGDTFKIRQVSYFGSDSSITERYHIFSGGKVEKTIVKSGLSLNGSFAQYDSKGNLIRLSRLDENLNENGETNFYFINDKQFTECYIPRLYSEIVNQIYSEIIPPGQFHLSNPLFYNLPLSIVGISDEKYDFYYTPIVSTSAKNLSSSDIQLYPNPASNVLQIGGIDMNNTVITAVLYDVNGKLVKKEMGMDHLMVSDLSSGIYYIVLFDKTGILYRGKFAKM